MKLNTEEIEALITEVDVALEDIAMTSYSDALTCIIELEKCLSTMDTLCDVGLAVETCGITETLQVMVGNAFDNIIPAFSEGDVEATIEALGTTVKKAIEKAIAFIKKLVDTILGFIKNIFKSTKKNNKYIKTFVEKLKESDHTFELKTVTGLSQPLEGIRHDFDTYTNIENNLEVTVETKIWEVSFADKTLIPLQVALIGKLKELSDVFSEDNNTTINSNNADRLYEVHSEFVLQQLSVLSKRLGGFKNHLANVKLDKAMAKGKANSPLFGIDAEYGGDVNEHINNQKQLVAVTGQLIKAIGMAEDNIMTQLKAVEKELK